jgi:hypothetical protein
MILIYIGDIEIAFFEKTDFCRYHEVLSRFAPFKKFRMEKNISRSPEK